MNCATPNLSAAAAADEYGIAPNLSAAAAADACVPYLSAAAAADGCGIRELSGRCSVLAAWPLGLLGLWPFSSWPARAATSDEKGLGNVTITITKRKTNGSDNHQINESYQTLFEIPSSRSALRGDSTYILRTQKYRETVGQAELTNAPKTARFDL